jgi:uncharacterized protein (DUF934 family)
MRHILRRHEVVADEWVHLGEVAEGTTPEAVIVPLPEFRKDAAKWQAFGGRLGLRVAPADRVEDFAADLARVLLVAVEFPNPGDGRGYTTGRLLRDRYGFKGELRAVGHVKRDQIFILARTGFDAFEVAPTEDIEAAAQYLRRYSVAYQPGAPTDSIRKQRYSALR